RIGRFVIISDLKISREIAALFNDKSVRKNRAGETARFTDHHSPRRYARHRYGAVDLYDVRPYRKSKLGVALFIDMNVPRLDLPADFSFPLDRDIAAADQFRPQRSFDLGRTAVG